MDIREDTACGKTLWMVVMAVATPNTSTNGNSWTYWLDWEETTSAETLEEHPTQTETKTRREKHNKHVSKFNHVYSSHN